jgi:hypothetical protein
MLVGGGMEDHIGFQPLQYMADILGILQFAYHRNNGGGYTDTAGLEYPEFPVYLVDGVLAMAKKVKPLHPGRQKLPGKFRSYGTSGSGDEYPPAAQPPDAFLQAVWLPGCGQADPGGLSPWSAPDGHRLPQSGPRSGVCGYVQSLPV